VLLVGIVPVTLVAGVVASLILKKRRPAVYAAIGGVHVEDGHVPPFKPADDEITEGARP